MDVNIVLIISITINIMLTLALIFIGVKVALLGKKYNSFISKFDKNNNIEDTLKEYINKIGEINEENKLIKANIVSIEKQLDNCVQRVGMVRYDAFEDVGSELSFALAVLDNHENGYVLNAVYGRNSSSIFAKPIEAGTSAYNLSDEEIKALSIAKEK